MVTMTETTITATIIAARAMGMEMVTATEAPAAEIPMSEHGALRQALRAWRSRKSQEMGVPPYTLFWDRTLDELCLRRPSTQEDLAGVWGIGEEKRRKFGAELLAVIAGCAE